MLLARAELPAAFEAMFLALDVVVLVLSDRHVRVRDVRDLGKTLLQRLGPVLLSLLLLRDGFLQSRHLGHQLGRARLVLGLLGGADLLGEGIAPLLGRLSL